MERVHLAKKKKKKMNQMSNENHKAICPRVLEGSGAKFPSKYVFA